MLYGYQSMTTAAVARPTLNWVHDMRSATAHSQLLAVLGAFEHSCIACLSAHMAAAVNVIR